VITTLDLASDLIEPLRRDALTKDRLRAHLQCNAQILKSNVEQAQHRHGGETTHALEQALPRYVADGERILANYEAFSGVAARLVQQVAHTYGRDVPDTVLVPCLGLYANGGWAERVDDTSYSPLKAMSP